MPRVELEPELVLSLFLPPLLYRAGVNMSWRGFRADLRLMAQGFKAAGARVLMFDNILNNDDSDDEKLRANLTTAREAGIEIINVSNILNASPEHDHFRCLDHIHMTEPYHRIMAKEWLKAVLAANQTTALP